MKRSHPRYSAQFIENNPIYKLSNPSLHLLQLQQRQVKRTSFFSQGRLYLAYLSCKLLINGTLFACLSLYQSLGADNETKRLYFN
ncbi:hypothetical protein DGG96_14240 [Legionella qingyii]|uniref:Uncharacterized protein n=1 Tax=Legionella qingyii TaxID=2184757 RepID=A0A317U0S5_9GAMM|nr:hypothetical protein [Legionella qingyii]PWY54959.1 hypothetical protein DGG96_14240 [Legionella qingyii]